MRSHPEEQSDGPQPATVRTYKRVITRAGVVMAGVRCIGYRMNHSIPFDPNAFPWPTDWRPLDETIQAESAECLGDTETYATDEAPRINFADELRREMPLEHRLARRKLVPIACSTIDPDDVLFYTDDPIEPFAFVHLTWHVERNPAWPYTRTYRAIDDFLADCSGDEWGR